MEGHEGPTANRQRLLLAAPAVGIKTGTCRTGSTASATILFVLGVITFVLFQSQLLFSDFAQISGLQSGLVPRNDGGILLGALLIGGSAALMLFAYSPRRGRARAAAAGAFGGSVSFLLALHFTIFVNAFLLPDARTGEIAASFLFNDSAQAIPIAVYLLALFTGALILVALLAAIALVAPDLWDRKVLHPQNVEAHRTRIVLLGLFVLGTGAAFVRQFFSYALTGDRYPGGGTLALNVTVVYYLLAFALVLALLAFAARTALLAWGDLRVSPSYNFRRSYRSVTNVEAGLWVVILILNTILLLAGPTFQPGASADRVFAVNSKGVSLFFHLVAALYITHRWTSHRYLRFLRAHPEPPSAARGWDLLATLSVTIIILWSALAVAFWPTDVTPLTRLAVRLAIVAAILPLFAFRPRQNPFRRPLSRSAGAPYLLLAATTLSALAGIMLWAIGNSIDVRYLEGRGFLATSSIDRISFRWAGALYLALAVVLCLRSLATQFEKRVHAAPLLVVGFSLLLGLNLLFVVTPASIQPDVGRTDVIVGFNHVVLRGVETFALLAIGVATAAVGYVASALLILRGTKPPNLRALRETPATASKSPASIAQPTALPSFEFPPWDPGD